MLIKKKFLSFRCEKSESGKTVVCDVLNNSEGFRLGKISFRGGWRKYIMAPANDTIFDDTCMDEISSFCKFLNEGRMEERRVKPFIGKTLKVVVDRPIGFEHKKNGHKFIYPINYGFYPGYISPDEEELDVYILDVDERLDEGQEIEVHIIGAVKRFNDEELKLLGVRFPEKAHVWENYINGTIAFQEDRYLTNIILK